MNRKYTKDVHVHKIIGDYPSMQASISPLNNCYQSATPQKVKITIISLRYEITDDYQLKISQ